MTVTIVLAEPRELYREALAGALQDGHGVRVLAATAEPGKTLLQVQRVRPQVLVASGPTREVLLELTDGLWRLERQPAVLVLDRTPCEESLLHAVECGAAGYVTGGGGLHAIAEAIQALARGDTVVPPAMLGPLLRRLIQRQREASLAAERLVTLTPREREVLALLADGADATGIAGHLVISPETARTHIQRILRKLGVHSRLEAITLVATTGLADRLERLIERSAS